MKTILQHWPRFLILVRYYKVADELIMSYAWVTNHCRHCDRLWRRNVSRPALMKSPYFVLDQAEEFMDYLRDGWHFDVLCRTDAYLRNSYWYGEWVVVLVSPDEKQEIPLLKARRGGTADDMRLFKTVNGMYSFCKQYSVSSPIIPSFAGDRERQRVSLPGTREPTQRSE